MSLDIALTSRFSGCLTSVPGTPVSGRMAFPHSLLYESGRPGCDLLAGRVPDLLELVGAQLLGVVAFPL